MKERYRFREIRQEELSEMFEIILARMRWMDEQGIRQWNVTCYDEVYPMSYYEEKRRQGEIFVLEDRETGRIVCVGALKKEDDRWQDDTPALYLHHFATRLGERGVGRIYLKHAEELILSRGMTLFRLDSADDNEALTRYYEELGFLPVGRCVDGLYTGILREKSLV